MEWIYTEHGERGVKYEAIADDGERLIERFQVEGKRFCGDFALA